MVKLLIHGLVNSFHDMKNIISFVLRLVLIFLTFTFPGEASYNYTYMICYATGFPFYESEIAS